VSLDLGLKIQKWAQPSWSFDVMSYPTGICESCRRLLFFCEKEGTTELPGRPGAVQHWQDFHMENIAVPRGQLATSCACPICRARKSSSASKGSGGSLKNVKIVKSAKIVTEKEEEVAAKPEEENTMCKECFQPRTGVGIRHECTPAAKKRNLAELVTKEVGREEIMAKVLKDAVGEGSDKVKLKQMKGGNSLRVTLGQSKVDAVGEVDAEVAAKLKKGLDLSTKDLKKALHILRKGNVKVH
jgi:hypothetical protein